MATRTSLGWVIAKGNVASNSDLSIWKSSQHNISSVSDNGTGLRRINIAGSSTYTTTNTGLTAGEFTVQAMAIGNATQKFFNQINMESSTSDSGSGCYFDFQIRFATSGTATDKAFSFVVLQSDGTLNVGEGSSRSFIPEDEYSASYWGYAHFDDSSGWPTHKESINLVTTTDLGTGDMLFDFGDHPKVQEADESNEWRSLYDQDARIHIASSYRGDGNQQYTTPVDNSAGKMRFTHRNQSGVTDPDYMTVIQY